MTMSFHKFVIIETAGIAAMYAAINGSYTSWLWHELDPITLNGASGIAFDLAATPVWIAVVSCLLGTAGVRSKLLQGRVQMPPRTPYPAIFSMLPRGIFARAACLGAVAAMALSAPLWLLLQAGGGETLSLGAALLAKIGVTVLLSAVIVPVVIHAALPDVQSPQIAATA